ncbi:MAG: hypothetical protein WC955_03865 [Elusimicrobiota bacterium]
MSKNSKRPTLRDSSKGLGVFFGSGQAAVATKPETQVSTKVDNQKSTNTVTLNSTLVDKQISRKVEPRKPGKISAEGKPRAEGVTQISLWLPTSLVKDIKIQAIKEGETMSDFVAKKLNS